MPSTATLLVLGLVATIAYLAVANRGRDLVAVTFCRGRSYVVDTIVSPIQEHPWPALVRAMRPYIVSHPGTKPMLVVAQHSMDAARVLFGKDAEAEGRAPIVVECALCPHRIVEVTPGTPGTWAMVHVPRWLGFLARTTCEHGLSVPHGPVVGVQEARDGLPAPVPPSD